VVEFWTPPFGEGLEEWRTRIIEVTQNPQTLDPALGPDVGAREALMSRSYERVFQQSPAPICRYGVAFVVAGARPEPPPWVEPIHVNDYFALYRVLPDACADQPL
jgi:hypothetical protein